MTESHFLTARCIDGCMTWLDPATVEPQIQLSRCRGQPWLDEIPTVRSHSIDRDRPPCATPPRQRTALPGRTALGGAVS